MDARDENARQNRVVVPDRYIGCRKSEIPADFVAMDHVSGNSVRLAKKRRDGFEIALFKCIPDA